ncbi:hypothetical protein Tco_0258512 [Tanacetum coccineum]
MAPHWSIRCTLQLGQRLPSENIGIAKHRAELTMVHLLSQAVDRDCELRRSASGDREDVDIAYMIESIKSTLKRRPMRDNTCL